MPMPAWPAPKTNLIHLRGSEDFVTFYLACRATRYSWIFLILKFTSAGNSWAPPPKIQESHLSLLKFYTYRLWSQQNQVNGLLVTALKA